MIANEQMISVSKIAHTLDVNERTVTRLIEAGRLKGHKIGRQWRVFESDLQDYLARQANRSDSDIGGQAAA